MSSISLKSTVTFDDFPYDVKKSLFDSPLYRDTEIDLLHCHYFVESKIKKAQSTLDFCIAKYVDEVDPGSAFRVERDYYLNLLTILNDIMLTTGATTLAVDVPIPQIVELVHKIEEVPRVNISVVTEEIHTEDVIPLEENDEAKGDLPGSALSSRSTHKLISHSDLARIMLAANEFDSIAQENLGGHALNQLMNESNILRKIVERAEYGKSQTAFKIHTQEILDRFVHQKPGFYMLDAVKIASLVKFMRPYVAMKTGYSVDHYDVKTLSNAYVQFWGNNHLLTETSYGHFSSEMITSSSIQRDNTAPPSAHQNIIDDLSAKHINCVRRFRNIDLGTLKATIGQKVASSRAANGKKQTSEIEDLANKLDTDLAQLVTDVQSLPNNSVDLSTIITALGLQSTDTISEVLVCINDLRARMTQIQVNQITAQLRSAAQRVVTLQGLIARMTAVGQNPNPAALAGLQAQLVAEQARVTTLTGQLATANATIASLRAGGVPSQSSSTTHLGPMDHASIRFAINQMKSIGQGLTVAGAQDYQDLENNYNDADRALLNVQAGISQGDRNFTIEATESVTSGTIGTQPAVSLQDPKWAIVDLLQRPYLAGNFTWTNAQAIGNVIGTIRLPESIYGGQNAPGTAATSHGESIMRHFAYFKSDFRVRICVNGTGYLQGLIMASWDPLSRILIANPGNSEERTALRSQCESVICDVSQVTEVDLIIPFESIMDYLPGFKLNAHGTGADRHFYYHLGSLDLTVLSTLTSVGAATISLDVSVFISCINPQVAISKHLQAFYSSTLPAQSNLRGMSQATKLKTVCNLNGEDDDIEILGRSMGYSSSSLVTYASKPSIVKTFRWVESSGVGYQIVSIPVTPMYGDFDTNVRMTPSRVNYCSIPFYLWRGTLKYTLIFGANSFHKGRMMVTFVPLSARAPRALMALTANELLNYDSVVLDVGDKHVFDIDVPFQYYAPYAEIERDTVSSDASVHRFSTGNLIMSVINPLRSTGATGIDVVVTIAMGNDFEFKGDRNIALNAATGPFIMAGRAQHMLGNSPGLIADVGATRDFEQKMRIYGTIYNHLKEGAGQRVGKISVLGLPVAPVFHNETHLCAVSWYSLTHTHWSGSLKYKILFEPVRERTQSLVVIRVWHEPSRWHEADVSHLKSMPVPSMVSSTYCFPVVTGSMEFEVPFVSKFARLPVATSQSFFMSNGTLFVSVEPPTAGSLEISMAAGKDFKLSGPTAAIPMSMQVSAPRVAFSTAIVTGEKGNVGVAYASDGSDLLPSMTTHKQFMEGVAQGEVLGIKQVLGIPDLEPLAKKAELLFDQVSEFLERVFPTGHFGLLEKGVEAWTIVAEKFSTFLDGMCVFSNAFQSVATFFREAWEMIKTPFVACNFITVDSKFVFGCYLSICVIYICSLFGSVTDNVWRIAALLAPIWIPLTGWSVVKIGSWLVKVWDQGLSPLIEQLFGKVKTSDTQDLSFEVPMQVRKGAQPGSSQGVVDAILSGNPIVQSILFILASYFGSSFNAKSSDLKNMGEFGRTISSMLAGDKALKEMINGFTKSIFKWTGVLDLAGDPEAAALMTTVQFDVEEWSRAIGKLTLEESKRDINSTLFQMEVNKLYSQAIMLEKVMMTKTIGVRLVTLIRLRVREIKSLKDEIYTSKGSSSFRIDPIHISVCGSPGVGKSFMATDLIHRVCDYFDEPKENRIFARNSTLCHWDSYAHQPVVYFDDLGQIANPSVPTDLTEMIPLKSNNPFALPMAHLDKKGTFFTSRYLFSTTNMETIDDHSHIRCPEAFARRRNIFIRMRWVGGQKCVYTDDFSHALFDILDGVTPTNVIVEGLNYEGLIAYTFSFSKDYFVKQNEALKKYTTKPFEVYHGEKAGFTPGIPQGKIELDELQQINVDLVASEMFINGDHSVDFRDAGAKTLYDSFDDEVKTYVTDIFLARYVEKTVTDTMEHTAKISDVDSSLLKQFLELWNDTPELFDDPEDRVFLEANGEDFVEVFMKMTQVERERRAFKAKHQKAFGSINDKTVFDGIRASVDRLNPDLKSKLSMIAGAATVLALTALVYRYVAKDRGMKIIEAPTPNVTYTPVSLVENFSDMQLSIGTYEGNTHHEKNDSAEGKWTHPSAPRYDYQKGNHRNGKVVRGRKQNALSLGIAEGAADVQCMTLINERFSQAMGRITHRSQRMMMTCVGGTVIALPLHFFLNVQQGDLLTIQTIQEKVEVQFNEDDIVTFQGGVKRDLCLYNVGPRMRPRKFLSKFWMTADDHNEYLQTSGALLNLSFDKDVPMLKNNVLPSIIRVGRVNSPDSVIYDVGGEKHVVVLGYRYAAHTVNGECGSLVVRYDRKSNGKLIGFHCASTLNEQTGFCEFITKEELDEAFLEFGHQIDGDGFIDGTKQSDGCGVFKISGVTVRGSVPRKMGVMSPRKTQFVPSKLHDMVSVHQYEPAILSSADPRLVVNGVRKEFKPMEVGMQKYYSPAKPFPKNLILQVQASMIAHFENRENNRFKREVLTDEQAINGVDLRDFFDSLNMKTSPGYPYVLTRPKNESGKRYLFSEVGEYPSGRPKYEINSDLLKLNLTVRERKAKLGQRMHSICIETPKDETIDMVKIYEKPKTRLFSILPVDYNILIRKYFLDWSVMVMESRLSSFCQVGVNANGPEWKGLLERLETTSDLGFAGDYKLFDGQADPEIFYSVTECVNAWYNDGEENARIRHVLINEVSHRDTLLIDTLVSVDRGMPSGFPLTVMYNSFLNMYYLKMAYLKLTNKSCSSFWENVTAIVYGDDNVVAIKPEIVEIYNLRSVSQYLDAFGITLTDHLKRSAANAEPVMKISDTTFLKRSFVRHPTISWLVLAPLNITSVEERLNWSNIASNTDVVLMQNVYGSLGEAVSVGEDYFIDLKQRINKALVNMNMEPVTCTYQDMFASFLEVFV